MSENQRNMPAHNRLDIPSDYRAGRLTIICEVTPQNQGDRRFECLCECGVIKSVGLSDLRSGHTRSCGCLRRELTRRNHLTHGLSKTPEFKIWTGMKKRCNKPDEENYHNYGGRGIAVCDRWLNSFSAFIEDMGPRPTSEHSIERENNNGNYCPENCVWATWKDQMRNTRRNRVITLDGVAMPLVKWAENLGMKDSGLSARLKWWPLRKALTTPGRKHKPYKSKAVMDREEGH